MLRKLSIVSCLLIIGFVAFGQKHKKQAKKATGSTVSSDKIDYKAIGSPMPHLNIYRRDGKYLNDENLKNDANLFLMLFNPTCEHCEDETILLKENIFRFKKSKIVLIAAPSMGPYLDYFVNNTKTDSFPSIQIGLDSCGYLDKVFRYETLPQINIYDKDRKLIKVFTSDTPIDSLKQYIE